MLDFTRMDPAFREEYNALLADSGRQGCEYTFVNISLWGRQRMTRFQDWVVLFSQYGRCSVYPFPVGVGDPREALDAIFEDARLRGIPCRLTGLSQEDCALLENYCPGKFRFHPDRDSFDYVYKIEDLAFLKGKRYQSKRNFCNRFWNANPHCQLVPITRELLPQVQAMLDRWYRDRLQGVKGLRVFAVDETAGVEYNYAYFPVQVDPGAFGCSRDALWYALRRQGNEARRYFRPALADASCYRAQYGPAALPVARHAARTLLCLPLFDSMSFDQVDRVCGAVLSVCNA